jgi:2-methylcitrate dehydratase PrpD
VFEGTHGLFKGFASDSITPDFSHLESFGKGWVSAGLAFKPYACGTMTQPFVDCALQASNILKSENIKEIHAHVGEGTVHRLWEPLEEKRNPSTPYGAKFSVPYCVAIGFLVGKAGLNEFTEEQLSRDDIRSLTSKITYSINPEDPYPGEYIGWLDVIDIAGNTHTFKQSCLRGGKQEPMSQQELEEKFTSNLVFASLDNQNIESARDCVNQLFNSKNNIRECVKTLATIGEKS